MNALNRNQEFPVDCPMRGVPNMSVDSAPAIAGGFSLRALHGRLPLPQSPGVAVPIGTAPGSGDAILFGECRF
jgi:hypothetical protein